MGEHAYVNDKNIVQIGAILKADIAPIRTNIDTNISLSNNNCPHKLKIKVTCR